MARLVHDAVNSEQVADVRNLAVLRRYANQHAARRVDYSDVLRPALDLYVWRQEFNV